MFVTPDQVLAHLIGDYFLQSDWMATEKTKRSLAAFAHAFCYVIPFMFLDVIDHRNMGHVLGLDMLVIFVSHYLIDHYRLARYVCWAKNFLAPEKTLQLDSYPAQYATWWKPWKVCSGNGYPPERPIWLTTWLLILTDNVIHVVINAAALKWL